MINTGWLNIFIGAIFGTLIGSFINAAAMRTAAENKWWGLERSVCDNCAAPISPKDLIPVVSYIMLRGRCRSCRKTIAPRHFISEVISGILGGLFVYCLGTEPSMFFSFTVLFFLLFHSLTDIEAGYIYDAWALAMAAAGLALRAWGGLPAVIDGAAGAALGFGLMCAIIFLSRDGMGFGDAMLMLGIGAVFGWKMTILVLYLGFMAAGLVVLPLLIMKKVSRKDSIPLAPFLSIGAVLAIFTAGTVFGYLGFHLPWPWAI